MIVIKVLVSRKICFMFKWLNSKTKMLVTFQTIVLIYFILVFKVGSYKGSKLIFFLILFSRHIKIIFTFFYGQLIKWKIKINDQAESVAIMCSCRARQPHKIFAKHIKIIIKKILHNLCFCVFIVKSYSLDKILFKNILSSINLTYILH